MKKIVLVITFFMVVISLSACSSEKNKHNETISIVYNGHFNGYQDKASIGKAFDKFFKNPKWKSYGDDRPTIVAFFGILEMNDEKIGVGCEFIINIDNSFELTEVRLGENERVPYDEISDFIKIIYSK